MGVKIEKMIKVTTIVALSLGTQKLLREFQSSRSTAHNLRCSRMAGPYFNCQTCASRGEKKTCIYLPATYSGENAKKCYGER